MTETIVTCDNPNCKKQLKSPFEVGQVRCYEISTTRASLEIATSMGFVYCPTSSIELASRLDFCRFACYAEYVMSLNKREEQK